MNEINQANEKKWIKASINNFSAFSPLIETYQNPLYRYFLVALKNQALAEEFTQDCLIKAFEALSKFDSNKPFEPWLFRIARNMLLNHYQKRSNQKQAHQTWLENKTKNKNDPEDFEIDPFHYLTILTEEEQEIVRLKYLETLSSREIALRFEKSENAINLIIHKAKEKLKNFYQGDIQ